MDGALMTGAALIAGAILVASGLVTYGFLRFVRSFGDYTTSQREFTGALLATHQSNMLVHESSVRLFEQLQAQQQTLKAERVA